MLLLATPGTRPPTSETFPGSSSSKRAPGEGGNKPESGTKRPLRQRLEELVKTVGKGSGDSAGLQSAVIPGLKEFYERDIVPTACS